MSRSLLSLVSRPATSAIFQFALTLTIPLGLYFLYRVTHPTRTSSQKSGSPRRKKQRRSFHVELDDASSHGTLEETDRKDDEREVWTALGLEQPLVIAMVGLPARGKSYIVKMIIRYLKWIGFECDVFNVGSYRRKIGLAGADSSFFDTSNADGNKMREEMAMKVQEEMYAWLRESENKRRVAIFDATNTTKSRRLELSKRAKRENVFLLFVESICDDKRVLERNYELKLQNDDYKGTDPAKARQDFLHRVVAYERVYETIEDNEDNEQISYIKLINVGQKVITRNCTGYVPSQISFYLQNVHISPRKIYLSLNAENTGLMEDSGRLLCGPSGRLTEDGRQYSLDLAKFIQVAQEGNFKEQDLGKEVLVIAGTAPVDQETLLHVRMLYSCYNTPLLNELRGGDLQGMTRTEIKSKLPLEYEKREANKLHYRYPGGESYLDVIERIRPVIIELERQRRSVLVVCHLAVLR